MSPWVERIFSQDTQRNLECCYIWQNLVVSGIQLLEWVLVLLMPPYSVLPGSRKVLICRFSILTAPQFLDVIGHLEWYCHRVFCQTCLLGYKVVQFLFLLDFFISWKLVSLFAMLINVLLIAAYRNTCLCSDTRQTR